MNKTLDSGKTFAAITTLGLLIVLATFSVSAQSTSTNDLDVNVSVADQTIIDIQPSRFAWGYGGSGINPGEIAGPSEELNGYGRIQVENLGSVNISQVWFNTTAPSERPFGTANRNLYDSANFIQLSSNASGAGDLRDSNTFVNRVEYAAGQEIIYLQTPNNWDFGRFRNGSSEYFWTLDTTGSGTGTGMGGAIFRIGVEHHNSTQTGSTNLDDPCAYGDEGAGSGNNCNGYSLTEVSANSQTYAVTDVEVGATDSNIAQSDGGANYCAVMNANNVQTASNPRIEFIKWNPGHPAIQAAGGDCETVTQYMINGTELAPGDWQSFNIRANVPYGVVSGNIPTGQLTVLATSN